MSACEAIIGAGEAYQIFVLDGGLQELVDNPPFLHMNLMTVEGRILPLQDVKVVVLIDVIAILHRTRYMVIPFRLNLVSWIEIILLQQ